MVKPHDGIDKSIRRLEQLLSARCTGATGDLGGGGGIQKIIKPFVDSVLVTCLASWLLHYFENSRANEDGNVDAFVWSSELIDPEGHNITGTT